MQTKLQTADKEDLILLYYREFISCTLTSLSYNTSKHHTSATQIQLKQTQRIKVKNAIDSVVDF